MQQLSDKAQASLNKVISAFERGDLSPVTSVIKIRRHKDDKTPSHAWSFGNQIMAFIQADGELDCRGFRQWEEVGRNVKKGASAVYILAPLTFNVDDAKSESGKKMIVKGFRTIPVFPLTMTEGDALPSFDYSPDELPPLYEVAQRLGIDVSYGATDARTGGWYSPKENHIHLGALDAPIFFHELAHAAHDKFEKLKGGQNSEQETIAEFTAAVLADLYGMSYTGNAWTYIQLYSVEPLSAIYKALAMVEKVLSLILDGVTPDAE
jgi:hypothetical protein